MRRLVWHGFRPKNDETIRIAVVNVLLMGKLNWLFQTTQTISHRNTGMEIGVRAKDNKRSGFIFTNQVETLGMPKKKTNPVLDVKKGMDNITSLTLTWTRRDGERSVALWTTWTKCRCGFQCRRVRSTIALDVKLNATPMTGDILNLHMKNVDGKEWMYVLHLK